MKNPEYYKNPYLSFWQDEVVSCELVNEKYVVILKNSNFYPTGGGQDNDLGWIGSSKVENVEKNTDSNQILHDVTEPCRPGLVECKLDVARRLSNMQHHSGQHILSSIFQKILNINTLSVKIYADKPSYVDLQTNGLTNEQIKIVEENTTKVILNGTPIHSYLSPKTELKDVYTRADLDMFDEIVRVVDIQGIVASLCCGTHCLKTSEIMALKIVKTEKVKNHLRVYFVCGTQYQNYVSQNIEIVKELTKKLNTSTDNLLPIFEKINTENIQKTKEISVLKNQLLQYYTEEILLKKKLINQIEFVFEKHELIGINDLRNASFFLQKSNLSMGVLYTNDQEKLSLLVFSNDEKRFDANQILQKLLEGKNGKGGGNLKVSQGNCEYKEMYVENMKENFEKYVKELIN